MSLATELTDGARAQGELDAARVMSRAAGENFPVALSLLPRSIRSQLLAIYGYARFIDEIGDGEGFAAPSERLSRLDWAEEEIDRALLGEAEHPVFVAVGSAARAIGASRRPFVDLIEANRLDQRRLRYEDFASLEQYCALSANPVGHLVLAVFGSSTTRAIELSDRVCTGLQLIEHWQDVVEDLEAGRVYLPGEDLERFSVREEELQGPVSPALRRLLAFETGRAKALLLAGSALPSLLGGFGRLAVAGFIGGGLAQAEALAAAGYDVFSGPVKATKAKVAARAAALYLTGGAR